MYNYTVSIVNQFVITLTTSKQVSPDWSGSSSVYNSNYDPQIGACIALFKLLSNLGKHHHRDDCIIAFWI